MVKDINGKEITPGLYRPVAPGIHKSQYYNELYQVYELEGQEGTLMMRGHFDVNQHSLTAFLSLHSIKLVRLNPSQVLEILASQIDWIQEHFPETVQNLDHKN